MDNMVLKIKKLYKDAIIPKYQTEGSVGFDFHAISDIQIEPTAYGMTGTGLSVEVPKGTCMLIFQRSGISKKYSNYIGTSVGVIDEDYRGEIMMPLINHNKFEHLTIKKGNRIAQGVVIPISKCEIIEMEELSETERGQNGFGSTGK